MPEAASVAPRSPTLLPAPPTSFVGRERELNTCGGLLLSPDVRLLTLTGPGGIGKTRLAIALGGALRDRFTGGVYFVDLAPVSDPTLVTAKIAESLELEEAPNQAPLVVLTDFLASQDALVLLDNFEQVLPAAMDVAELMKACRSLKLLVTSRTVLHVYGEHEFRVPPLSLPERRLAARPTIDWLSECEATALFVQRARAVNPDLELTTTTATAVAQICAHLDGLPLAIELAAARARVLPPPVLLNRLSSRLKLLVGGPRNVPGRQQTLRATLDWSYGLLEADEQALFRRLGVFVGGCSLEAIEALHDGPAGDTDDPLSLVTSLLDKSLVWLRRDQDEARFGMLETIREYASERLRADQEIEAIQRQHATYYLSLAEEAEQRLYGPEQVTWVGRLTRDHDNLRAALRWASEHGEVEIALRIGVALGRFWRVHGHLGEGQQWLETGLRAPEVCTPRTRARALGRAGMLALFRGEYELALDRLEDSLRLSRELHDEAGIAYSLNYLAGISLSRGDYVAAWPLYEESLSIFRTLNDPWGTRAGLNNLGEVARGLGEYARARRLYDECVTLSRAAGDRFMEALGLANLASTSREEGDIDRAGVLAAQSLMLFREQGAITDGLLCLEVLAGVAAARGEAVRAARLFGAAETLLESAGVVFQGSEQSAHDRDVARARVQLDAATFAAEWRVGRALSLGDAVELALAASPPAFPRADAKDTLTAREREVVALVTRGFTNRQIAEELVIAEGTAELHVSRILSKLGFHSRAQVAAWATQRESASRGP